MNQIQEDWNRRQFVLPGDTEEESRASIAEDLAKLKTLVSKSSLEMFLGGDDLDACFQCIGSDADYASLVERYPKLLYNSSDNDEEKCLVIL
jgi:hypothetical protein